MPGDDGMRLGDFLLRREIGRGGMGVVYEAEQISLRRVVAVKVLPAQQTLSPLAIERFRREAALAAKLKHPGIVEVHAVGEADGTHFFAMEFVRGSPLDKLIDRISAAPVGTLHGVEIVSEVRSLAHRPLAVPDRGGEPARVPTSAWDRGYIVTVVRLVAAVADALQHAHENGVVHRDVKPSNILLREDGTPVLTDFGLARALGIPALTRVGEFAGSPHYVSPEQALSKEADGRSDVFSLGVTLYELLTLRRPFEGDSVPEILSRIATKSPRAPKELNPEIPPDLETICLTALENDPDRRYPTAGAMAADLRRFLDFRPVLARPVGRATRAQRWARRNPVVAGLLAAVAVLCAALVVVSVLGAIRLRGERDAAERSAATAREALRAGLVNEARAWLASSECGRRRAAREALMEAHRIRPGEDLRDWIIAGLLCFDLEPRARFPKAADVGFDCDPDLELAATSDERGEITVRRVDGGEIVRRLPGRGDPAFVIRIDPTGRRLAAKYHARAKSFEAFATVFDLETGKPVFETAKGEEAHRFDFSPDGRLFAVVGKEDPRLVIHDLEGGRELLRVVLERSPYAVEFDPSGRRVAISSLESAGVEIRDVETGDLDRLLPSSCKIRGLSWSPDGQRLVGAGNDNGVYVWDLKTGGEPRLIDAHEAEVSAVAFDPSGTRVASVGWQSGLRVVDSHAARLLLTRAGGGITVRFSRDGARVAVESPDGAGEVLDVAGRSERRLLYGHVGPDKGPWMVDFSPDGALIASCADDAVRLWDARSGSEVGMLPVRKSQAVLFHSDGATLFTLGENGIVEWRVERRGESVDFAARRALDFPGGNGHLALTPDGRTLAAVSRRSDRIVTFDLSSDALPRVEGRGRALSKVAIDPAGRFVAAGTWGTGSPDAVHVWDRDHPGSEPILLEVPEAQVSFSSDGGLLLAGGREGYSVFETGTFSLVRSIPLAVPAPLPPIAYSDDGSVLALVASKSEIVLHDAQTFERLATLADPDHRRAIWFAFSPDGGTLAVATFGRENVVVLYDLRSIREALAAYGLDWETNKNE